MTAHDIVESLLDPKDEISGMFDWKSILAELGFVPTRCAGYCEAMVRTFPSGTKLLVLGQKRDSVADKLEVMCLEKQPGQKQLVMTGKQDVGIESLEGLIVNYLRLLESVPLQHRNLVVRPSE